MKIIVPVTDWKERFEIAPWMIKLEPNQENGLTKTSSADCFQERSVSQKRIVRKIGSISFETLNEIKVGLSTVLSIDIE